jgi:hypothetical protein
MLLVPTCVYAQLPDFLDGLFNMLSDHNREIQQAAEAALEGFLRFAAGQKLVQLRDCVTCRNYAFGADHAMFDNRHCCLPPPL